jgi:hypothetical protein
MSSRVVKRLPNEAGGNGVGTPFTADRVAKALAKTRQLKASFPEGSDDFALAGGIENVLEAELELDEGLEDFASKFVEGLNKYAPTGDAKAVRMFLSDGIAVAKAQLQHNRQKDGPE